MSAQNQDREKQLQVVKSSSATSYRAHGSSCQDELAPQPEGLSALQELSLKIDRCLKKQKQVHFVTKEIADIVKKFS